MYSRCFLISAVILMLSCSDGPKDDAGKLHAASDANAQPVDTHALPEKPTNPDGGKVPGRADKLSPLARADKARRNAKHPIIVGESVAGITLHTTLREAQSILSSPLRIRGKVFNYAEKVQIIWDKETARPEAINVDEGYEGTLTVPDEFGPIKVGQDVSRFFTAEDPFGAATMRAWARFFDKKEDGYNCTDLRTCQILVDGAIIVWSLELGDIIFDKRADRTRLISVTLVPPKPKTPPLTDTIVFGRGTNRIGFTDTPDKIDDIIGKPIASSLLTGTFYDNGNLVIFFGVGSKPSLIAFQMGYAGTIELPKSIGKKKIGDSLSEFFTADDPTAMELVKDLARFFDGQVDNVDYNCFSVNACTIEVSQTEISLVFDKGRMILSNDSRKRIEQINLIPPPPSRTEPLNLTVTFPTAIGGVTLDSARAAVDAELGVPWVSNEPLSFYDNENITVEWDAGSPMTPNRLQINRNYAGDIAMPAPIGTVKMGADLSNHFPESDELGEGLLRQLSIAFRNESAGYDCVDELTCQAIIDRNEIVFFFKDHGIVTFDVLTLRLGLILFNDAQELPN